MGSPAVPNAASRELAVVDVVKEDDSGPVGETLPFSWLDPHPIFVILLVGSDEKPFGIHLDFLCYKSSYFRDLFAKNKDDTIEHIVKLPDTPVRVFAHAQNYMYTGEVFTAKSADDMPTYDVLVGIWKLGYSLGIGGLCERTLEAMTELKRLTRSIPATPLLVQVWKDAPEGSSIRRLLLSWAAEFLRSSEGRSEFARSLPQELLSELVIAMSSNGDFPLVSTATLGGNTGGSASVSRSNSIAPRGTQYYDGTLDDGIDEESGRPLSPATKRARYNDYYSITDSNGNSESAGGLGTPTGSVPLTPAHATAIAVAANRKLAARTSLPTQRGTPKKRGFVVDVESFSPDQRLRFCADLLTRMLSGPGFWTRLVGPFREPVDPVSENIPDYFSKVKRPMDLGTIKSNLENGRYRSEDEFAADVRQIFANVYTYWKKTDPIWSVCERLEKTFEEKYAQMNKWLSKMDGEDFQ